MQVDTQTYLRLLEDNNEICFWDIEATGLKGDYDSILCVSILPFHGDPVTVSVPRVGDDREAVREAKEILEEFQCWVGFYSRGYDIKMLNTRLFKHKIPFVSPRHHLDLFFKAKHALATSRKSQAHLMNWLRVDNHEDHRHMEKKSMGADMWAEMNINFKENMAEMIDRCERDVLGLRDLYKACKPIIKDVTK